MQGYPEIFVFTKQGNLKAEMKYILDLNDYFIVDSQKTTSICVLQQFKISKVVYYGSSNLVEPNEYKKYIYLNETSGLFYFIGSS